MNDPRERFDSIIRMAMDRGPEFIHDLWQDYFDYSAAGVSSGAARQLGVLQDIRRYSAAILSEAEERFPMPEFTGEYGVPSGFIRRKGLLDRLFSRDVTVVLRRPESPTWIKLSRPLQTDMRFPWQMALAGNEYIKQSQGTLVSSRYVKVLGSTAYEMCYSVPHARSLDHVLKPDHPDFLAELQRAEVTFVCKPGNVVRALLETRSRENDKSSFDEFVQSLR